MSEEIKDQFQEEESQEQNEEMFDENEETNYVEEDEVFEYQPEAEKKKVNWLLIINIILVLAVGALFFFHFTGNNSGGSKEITVVKPGTIEGGEGGVNIAYVNSDSLDKNFAMHEYILDSANRVQKYYEKLLLSEAESIEKQQQRISTDYQSGFISKETAQRNMAKLNERFQEAGKKEMEYNEKVANLTVKLQEMYTDTLNNFLRRYKEVFGIDMVFHYSKNFTNIMYVDESLDITEAVIQKLNEEYYNRYPYRKKEEK